MACTQWCVPKPIFWETKKWAACVVLLMASVHDPLMAVSKHEMLGPGHVGSSPTGLWKAPASPLGYLSGCSTLSGWRNATMPPVTSGRKEKGKCVLSRWVKALHVSFNLLNCSLTLSFDFYKKSFKESLGEPVPTCAKPQTGAGVHHSCRQAFVYFMTKSGMNRQFWVMSYSWNIIFEALFS